MDTCTYSNSVWHTARYVDTRKLPVLWAFSRAWRFYKLNREGLSYFVRHENFWSGNLDLSESAKLLDPKEKRNLQENGVPSLAVSKLGYCFFWSCGFTLVDKEGAYLNAILIRRCFWAFPETYDLWRTLHYTE